MLAIDENKMKLLKMTEKLLEVAIENREDILKKYEEITTEIDNTLFLNLINEINNTNYQNHSLEEQLVILNNIDNEYNELYELECGFKNTYELYSNNKLELSNLSIISIDEIRNKINAIQGYLLGMKIINDNKEQLKNLNLELVAEEKKRLQMQEKFRELELQLRENFINAEGRVYDAYGNLEYTSVLLEYKNVGFDVKELLLNTQNLQNEIDTVSSLMNSSEEKLRAAEICFENDMGIQNEEAYNSILKENAYLKYKMLLLSIIDLISKEYIDYNLLKQKRSDLIQLIRDRVECLSILGVKLLVDPISRIRIDEQLELIESIGNNEDKISFIRRKIANINADLENKIEENKDYRLIVATDNNFIKENHNINDVTIENSLEVVSIEENQVIAIREITNDFMLPRVIEKTREVVKRVFEMFCHEDDSKEKTISPELVIAESNEEENNIFLENVNLFEDSMTNDLDISNNSNDNLTNPDEFLNVSSTSNNNSSEQYLDDNKYATDNLFTLEDSSQIFTSNDVDDDNIETKEKNDSLEYDNGLFEDVSHPFDSVPLFSEKYDGDMLITPNNDLSNESTLSDEKLIDNNNDDMLSVTVNNPNEDVNSVDMPDIFWSTQDNNNDNDDMLEVPSFDDQIDALMGDTKVLKKVA